MLREVLTGADIVSARFSGLESEDGVRRAVCIVTAFDMFFIGGEDVEGDICRAAQRCRDPADGVGGFLFGRKGEVVVVAIVIDQNRK